MNSDPDFIITANGQDVSVYCKAWDFTDDEEGMSELSVELVNPDMKLSGQFQYGQQLQIRFGYSGDLSGQAQFLIQEVEERYPVDGSLSVTVVGRDESSKMGGGRSKGAAKGGKDGEVLRSLLKPYAENVEVKGEGTEHKKAYVMNENGQELAWKFGRNIKPESSGGGSSPTSPMAKDSGGSGGEVKGPDGHQFSSAEGFCEGGKGRDANRQENFNNSHGQEPITATLELKGMPSLRAKTTVTVQNVGSQASGEYYVKKAQHSWKLESGYTTNAELIRGGSGKGGVGGDPPMVAYADEFQKGSMYIGPRKSQGGSGTTFMYGQGENVINFTYKVHPQSQRHGGEPKKGEGEGLDLRKLLKPYSTKDEGGGGQ